MQFSSICIFEKYRIFAAQTQKTNTMLKEIKNGLINDPVSQEMVRCRLNAKPQKYFGGIITDKWFTTWMKEIEHYYEQRTGKNIILDCGKLTPITTRPNRTKILPLRTVYKVASI